MRALKLFQSRANAVADPSPSRAVYRAHRLWLTPSFRAFLRIGLPAYAIILGVAWYFGDAGRVQALTEHVAGLRQSIEQRPEFMVQVLKIEGASEELVEDIREAFPIDLPISYFALNFEQLRRDIESLDPVAVAEVRLQSKGTLLITLQERVPVAVLQHETGLEMLDIEGFRVGSVADARVWPDFPLLAGRGAEQNVAEALALHAAALPITDQILGYIRVGERRWDVVLNGNRKILLPEHQPTLALDRILALHATQDVLARDIIVFDYRNALRPTLRMSQISHHAWRQVKNLEVLSQEDGE